MGELREIKAGGDKWADGVPEKARVVLENVLGECDRLIIVGIRRDTGATTGMRSFVVSREAPKTSWLELLGAVGQLQFDLNASTGSDDDG